MRTIKIKYTFRKYKDLVFNQALYSTGSRDDASDITQEVFIKYWDYMYNIKTGSVKSWLLKVTRNCCIDRSRKKKEQYFSELESGDAVNYSVEIPAGEDSDPERNFSNAEVRQSIIRAIVSLPDNIKDIMILRYIQDEPYDFISETLDVPVNTVKVYLHRGRKLLAEKLRKTMEE